MLALGSPVIRVRDTFTFALLLEISYNMTCGLCYMREKEPRRDWHKGTFADRLRGVVVEVG